MVTFSKGIAVVGSTTIDEIVENGRSICKLGGVTTYAGLTYSRHGIHTLAVSNLAEQDLYLLEKLKSENVAVRRGNSSHTTHFINCIKGDDRSQKMLLRADTIQAAQIHAILDQVDSLHLGPLHPLDIEWEAVDLSNRPESMIVLDIQGLTRKADNQNISTSVSDHLQRALNVSHIVKANGPEYHAVLDFYRMDPSELMRRFDLQEIVVTLGAKGGFVQKRDGTAIHYQASEVGSVADPTGAGDVFFAAYLVSRWADGKDIYAACRYAAGIASRQVAGRYIAADTLRLG
jgi:sugar/nucleoside kinase (ribokinase family)